MKNVLLIGHSGDLYGASRSLVKLAILLSGSYKVYVVLPEQGPLSERLKQVLPPGQIIFVEGLYIFTRKSFKAKFIIPTGISFLKSVSAIRRIIREKHISIVHTNSGVAPAGALASKLSGAKHIWHIREWFGDFKSFWPLYRTYMMGLSDRIICVSKTIATQFPASEKVVAIYNGFEIPMIGSPRPAFNEEEKALGSSAAQNSERRTKGRAMEFELPNGLREKLSKADLILGCTSRIRLIRKGQEYLIEAIGELSRKSGKNIQCILIGDLVPGYEWQMETLQELIRKYQIEDRIHFLGHKADALPYYQLFDVFVLPSGEPEPFGGVIMEAMSLGLPVIGSNAGGTTEQIRDDWNGYLFRNQDPADLAAKIGIFLEDKDKVRLFGERSTARIKEHFSLDLHKQRILELYSKV